MTKHMSGEYEEARDRNLAVPGVEYVNTSKPAVHSHKDLDKDLCEYIIGETEGRRYSCHNKGRYRVQRGPVDRVTCHQHLPRTVNEFWQIKPGRYGVSEHYEGYWVSSTSSVVVKMKDEKGVWR